MIPVKIIAVDFDGTLVTDKFPEIGEPILEVIYELQRQQECGAKAILWTSRVDEQLEEAIKWCRDHEIDFDAVNENLPEVIDAFGGDSRKIFAHEYWDDKAVLMPQSLGFAKRQIKPNNTEEGLIYDL